MNGHHRGQVLIITAAAMFVILGIAALVVDLGFSWMLHRQEQNAADPAAIAAARYLKDELGNAAWDQGLAEADACFYAQENGFFEGDVGCAAALAADELQVHTPPISGPYSGRPGFVQVIISETHPTMFARLFGLDESVVTTGAVAANTAGNSNSSSLVALQPTCTAGSAGDADGGGTINIFPVSPSIEGGYVHVNSPCGGGENGDDQCLGTGSGALSISGTLRAPYTYTVGSCTEKGSGVGHDCSGAVTPCLDEDAVPLGDPLAGLPEPQLSGFPNGECPDGDPSTPSSTKPCELSDKDCPPDPADPSIAICTLSPGAFYGGWDVKKKVNLELEPGMYIIAGGGIKLTGTEASIEAVTSPTGVDARVTIFSTDGPGCPSIAAQCQSSITFTAQQAFRAKATNAATCGLVSPKRVRGRESCSGRTGQPAIRTLRSASVGRAAAFWPARSTHPPRKWTCRAAARVPAAEPARRPAACPSRSSAGGGR